MAPSDVETQTARIPEHPGDIGFEIHGALIPLTVLVLDDELPGLLVLADPQPTAAIVAAAMDDSLNTGSPSHQRR